MDIDRMNALERASEGILRELWVATTEIKKLKEMNHACMNMIYYQKLAFYLGDNQYLKKIY